MTRRDTIGLGAAALATLAVTTPPAAASAHIRIGRYGWTGPGAVNTWWIETPRSVIVIDLQRDLTHARHALAAVQAIGKPVTHVLITHGHPDHYAGIGLFKQAFPAATVWSSAATLATIRDDHYGFNALLQRLAPGEFPDPVVPPDRVFADNATLELDGVRIVTREMGPSDANSMTAFYLPESGDLLAGDIVLPGMHLFFLEGASREWLGSIDRLRVLFPRALRLHPGHGESGEPAALGESVRGYVATARDLAARAMLEDGATDAARKRVADALLARYPAHGFPANLDNMIEIGLGGLFRELSRADQAPAR
jgi:glyoxylase-like metal-dependent hydrolase (beta-lactamase superfamily II)